MTRRSEPELGAKQHAALAKIAFACATETNDKDKKAKHMRVANYHASMAAYLALTERPESFAPPAQSEMYKYKSGDVIKFMYRTDGKVVHCELRVVDVDDITGSFIVDQIKREVHE